MVSSFLGGFGGAVIGQAVVEIVADNSGLEASLTKQQKALAGIAVAGFGAAIVAATSYETALTGVAKTTGLAGDELDDLGDRFRRLATSEIPMTATELANIGATAAQLGVEVQNLEAFTEVIAKLGTATNIVGEQGATQLARFINVVGDSQQNIDRIGSSLVDLGNNSATTEAEILDMATRLAAAGRQAGLTSPQVLGLAAAMSSLGLESEAGGTALSRVLLEIWSGAQQGEEGVRGFAEVAGMLPAEFLKIVRTDPAKALTAFIGGLATAESRGLNVVTMLDELSFGNVRVRDALLRLAGAQDLMNESMDLSSEAYRENVALQEEFELFAKTAANQLKLLRNNLMDLAITGGEVLLPVLVDITGALTAVLQGFADLPGEVQLLIAVWATLATLGPAVAAGMSRVVTQMIAMRTAAAAGNLSLAGMVTSLGPLGVAGAIAGVGIAADAILRKTTGHGLIDWLFRDPRSADAAAESINRVTIELERLRNEAARSGDEFNEPAERLRLVMDEVVRAAAMLERGQQGLSDTAVPLAKDTRDVAAAQAELKAQAEALSDAVARGEVRFVDLHRALMALDEDQRAVFLEAYPQYEAQAARFAGELVNMGLSLFDVKVRSDDAADGMNGLGHEIELVSAKSLATAVALDVMGKRGFAAFVALSQGIVAVHEALAINERVERMADFILRAAGFEPDEPAGGGGGGAAPKTEAERMQDLFDAEEDRRMRKLAEAFVRGGPQAVKELERRFADIDEEWESEVLPAMEKLGIKGAESMKEIFERWEEEVEKGKDALTRDVGNLLGFLISQTLAQRLDAAAGIGSVGATAGGGMVQNNHVGVVNMGVRPDIPGGIDVEMGLGVMRQSFDEVGFGQ